MKRSTVTKLIAFLIVLACSVDYAANVEAAGRRRGVSPAMTISGIVVDSTSEDMTVRNADGDHTLLLTPHTRIQGDVAIAAQVRARYVTDEDGHKVAVRIKAEHEPLEIRGIIQDLTPASLVLMTRHGEVTLTIDDGTIVVIDGVISTSGELVVGDKVEVDVLPMPDGSLLALLIVAEVEDIELEGTILGLTEDSLTLETASDVVEIGLTAETVVRIFGHEGTLADLRVGMHVEIKVERLADASLSALVIKVEDDFDLVELEGVIVSVTPTELVVLSTLGEEVTFAITPDTFVMRRGDVIPLAELQPGDRVEVKAFRDADGALVALRIKLKNDDHLEEFEGIIESIDGSLLVIALDDGSNVEVLVGMDTVIRVEREEGSVADLVPGRKVEVHALTNPDGSLTAVAIKVELEDDDDQEVEVHGVVTLLAPDSITVLSPRAGEIVFMVDESTIVKRRREVVPFSEIQVGDFVEVEAVADAAGVLTAVKISIESEDDDDGELEVEGDVTAVSDTSITLMTRRGEVTFEVTSETEIEIDDEPATIAAVLVGDEAEVEAFMHDGTLVAKKVEIERDDD
jgi:hypothetical protein